MDLPVVVIAGPTASGKTDLGVRLAGAIEGEIVSADSRQIYRHMDVGTAKPTPAERKAAPHHLIDVVLPDQRFSASEFAMHAALAIEEIVSRGRVPIVVGGSGFYLEALFEGLSPIPDVPDDVRTSVAEEVRSDSHAAYDRLATADPESAARFSASDPQRVARALEVYTATGKTISHFQALPREPGTSRRPLTFGLRWDRERLYERINQRARDMIEHGLVDEVRALYEMGYDRETYALRTFGYREIGAVLDGEMELEDAVSEISQGTRRYAKRQMTWFRNRSELTWLAAEEGDPLKTVLEAIGQAGIRLDSNSGA